MKLTYIRRSVLAAGLLAGSAVGHAATVTYTLPVFGYGVGHSEATPNYIEQSVGSFPKSVDLPKFFSDLGTLESVTLKLDYSMTGEVTIQNYASAPRSFSEANASVPLTLTGHVGLGAGDPNVSDIAVADVGPSATATPTVTKSKGKVIPSTFAQSVPAAEEIPLPEFQVVAKFPGEVTYKNLKTGGTVETTLTLNALLAAFTTAVNGNTFGAELKLTHPNGKGGPSYYVAGGSGGDLFVGGDAKVGGQITVTYTYTPKKVDPEDPVPTPEPMTTTLVGSAVLGLGVMLRRRNNKGKI